MKAAGRMLAVAVITVVVLQPSTSFSATVKEPSAIPATLSQLAAQRPLIASVPPSLFPDHQHDRQYQ